jgi:putative ABC transport system substrate-binding protein
MSSQVESFRKGLRELGYTEGKDLIVEYRSIEANVERIPELVRELLDRKIDVFVSTNFPAVREAKQITTAVPIVMVTTQDPVETGLITSLAHPGGNITGVTRFTRELSGKRLQLIDDVVPRLSRVGVLWDSNAHGPIIAFKEYKAAAAALKLELASLAVRGPNPDFTTALKQSKMVQAIITVLNPVFNRYKQRIADLALRNRVPSMCERGDYVEAGCLLSYSAVETESYTRAAWYVDRILKGTKPADLPVEQPTKFELVINLKTAKQIGLLIPPHVLARADRVIR